MLRIAINGFGRIGRNVLRAIYETGRNSHIRVVAINELADPEGIAHLLKYDTSHGRFPFAVELEERSLSVAGDNIQLLQHPELETLPWEELGVDLSHGMHWCLQHSGTRSGALAAGRKESTVFTTLWPGYGCHGDLRDQRSAAEIRR